MNKKLMISADEVAEAFGVSMSHTYKIVRLLNKDSEAKGFKLEVKVFADACLP